MKVIIELIWRRKEVHFAVRKSGLVVAKIVTSRIALTRVKPILKIRKNYNY